MKKISLLSALLCITLACFGQVNSYTFAYSSGTYTALSGGTALIPPNSGISGAGWFEQEYNVPLPFVYYFNGKGYSSVFVNSNGHLSFGKPTLVTNPRPHTVNNGQDGAIMGYACATTYSYSGGAGSILLGGLVDVANSNPITYGTIGSAPNRIFIVQWTNSERSVSYYPNSGGSAESLTFQIRLKETSNVAEIVYNTSTTSYSPAYNAVAGLSGATTADFNLVGGASWTAVTNNTVTSATNIPFTSTVSIPSGVTYTFTPPAGLQPTPCSVTPSSPTAVCNAGIACGSFSVSLSGLPASTGLTYQWQSSLTGITGSFSNITGATNATLTTTQTAANYYQCLVACGAGAQVASGSVLVGYEAACPTMPSYTYAQNGGYPNENIGQFQIAGGACGTTLNDVSNSVSDYGYAAYGTCCGTAYTYVDYTGNLSHLKLQGSTSSTPTFTATYNNYGGTYTAVVGVWIDLNDNGSFGDAGEYVGAVAGVAGTATAFTLTIPVNGFGTHRMRVRTASANLGYNTANIAPTGALNYFGQANDYLVEILPPTPTASNSSPVCPTGTLTLTAGALTGATYTWTGPLSYYSSTTSTTQNYTVPSTSAGGTYNLYTTVDGSNACATGTTSVTVNPQPTLTNATNSGPICPGSTLSLFANGSSNVTGYSWTGPVSITSPTSATATVPGATTAATGTYTVAVNNGSGSGCTVNYTTTAVVNPTPASITGVLQACPGTTTTLSDATGAGTWSSADNTIATVGSVTGIVAGVSANTVNITFTLTSTGCSTFAVVTINPLPSAINATSPFCPGSSVTLTDGTAGGTWSSGNTALATIGSLSGIATGVASGNPVITYTIPTGCYATTIVTVISTPPITGTLGICSGFSSTLSNSIPGGTWASSNTGVVSIGSSTGVATGISAGSSVITYTFPSGCTITATVGVTSTPATFTVSGGGFICSGGTGVHIFLSGSSAGISYQVLIGGVPTGAPVSGTGSLMDLGAFTTPGTYTVVANFGSPCAATMSSSATVAVNAAPTVYNVTGGGGYCAGGTGVTIGLNGSNVGINYQLFRGVTSVGSALAGTSTILNFGLQTTAGTYTVVATNSTTGCTATMNGNAVVTVNPLPTAFTVTVTGGGGYCAGGTGVTVGLGNSTSGINYQLLRGGIPTGSSVAGTGSAISYGLQTIAGTYTVIATDATTGCTNTMSGSAVVAINPLPTVFTVTGGGSFCAGGAGVNIGLSGSTVGVNYLLYLGPTLMGSLPGTGAPLTSPLINIPGVFTVVASNPATGCTSNMLGSATISVNPLPASFIVTGGGSYCAGSGGVHVGLSGSVPGTSYFVYNGATLAGGGSGTSAPLDFGLFTAPGVYSVSATIPGTGCNAVMGNTVTVSVNPLPVIYNVTGGGSYCAGGTGFHVGLSSSDVGVTYILLNSGVPLTPSMAGTGGSLDFGIITAAGVYTIMAISATTGCVSNMSGSAIISINPLPTAYTVTGGGNYCSGGAGLHIGLSNSTAGVNYQLFAGVTPAGLPMAGTGGVLDFGLQTGAGSYKVVATNTVTGCTNNMSGTVLININLLPSAFSVTGGGNYCFGGAGVTIGMLSSATGINYQLLLGGVATGSPMPGTGSAFSFGLQTLAGTYTVRATDAITGCTNTMTGSATVAINPLPATWNVTGGGSYCAGGTGVHVGLSNSGIGINYQLYNGISAVGAPLPGTGASLDLGARTAAGIYTVIAANTTTGCSQTMTGSATININTLPTPYLVIGGGNYCAGGTGIHVGLAASDIGMNYQLYNGVSGIGSPVAGTGGAIDFGLQTISGVYTVVATNTSTGCTNNMTGSVLVNINPLPSVFTVTGGGNDCTGGLGVHVGLNSSNAGISYQLYNGVMALGSPLPGTGLPLDFGLQTASGIYTVVAINSTTGCTKNMAGSATVNITALPAIFNITGGGNYCPSGAGVLVGLAGSDPAISYQLLLGGIPTGLTVTGTGSSISFGLQTAAGIYTVVAHGSTPGCTASMNGSAVVGINTPPALHSVTGGGHYCTGATGLNIGLDGSDAGVNYSLYLAGTPVGAIIAGTGSPINFGLQTAAGNYTVTATGATTMCSSPMTGSETINIDPLPAAHTFTGGGAFCIGTGGADMVLNGSDIGINYQLYNGLSGVGTPLPGTGAIIDFGLQSTAGIYTVVATNSISGCMATMTGSTSVSINPLPQDFNVIGGGGFCAGGAGVHVQLDGSATGINYQLMNGGVASGAALPGTGSPIDFGLKTVNGIYTVLATNATTGCSNTMTGASSVIANPLPNVYSVAGSSTGYCIGGAGITISLTGSDPGVNYLLHRDGTLSGGPFPGSGGPISFGLQTIAGNYTVTATNASTGCSVNMAGAAPIALLSLPVAYTVSGGGGYCTGGTGVHVYLSGSAAGASYQLYSGGGASGTPVSGTGGSLDFGLQTAGGIYTVVATNTAGCTNNMNGFATIAVNPLPSVYTVTGGGNYCAGGAGVPIGLSGSATGIQYQLHNGGSAIGAPVTGTGTGFNFPAQTAAGMFTIVATNSTTGCTNAMTGSAIININPLPVSFAVIGGGNYCTGSAGVHAGISGTESGVNYQLLAGGTPTGSTITGTGTAIDFGLQTTPGTYTVIAANSTTGCTNSMTGSVSVVVNSLPALYAVTGGGNYCAGGSGVHVGIANSAVGIDYTLHAGTTMGTIHGTGGAVDFGLQTTAGTYTVTATNVTTTCTSNMTGSVSVGINPSVVPAVSINTGSGDTVCSGHLITFVAIPVNGGTAPAYQWTINGITAGTGNSYAYLPVNGDIVAVTLTGNAMCATTSSVSDRMTMTVNTPEPPSVLIASNHGNEVCQGTTVTFTPVSAFGGNAPAYAWMKNGVKVDSAVTYTYTPVNGDLVYCVLHSNYNCRLIDTAVSNTINMTVDVSSAPTVTLSATNGGSAAPGVQIVLTATVSGGGPSPTYQWFVNGLAVAGATFPVYASSYFSDLDDVSCVVTSSGPCSGATGNAHKTIHIWAVGVNQVTANSMDIKLVPNPNKGTFSIKGNLGIVIDEDVTFEITDMIGQLVYTGKVVARNGEIDEHFRLSNLANGMYILNLRSGAGNKVFHVVIEQ